MLPRRYFAFSGKLLVGAVLLTTLASAQQAAPARVDYSKPKSHLFNFIAPYTPKTVPAPSFANSRAELSA